MTRARTLLAVASAAAVALPAAVPAVAAALDAQPVLGLADRETTIIGAAPAGEAGETWAYRRLPLDLPLVGDGSGALAFGALANPANPAPQLLFERWTDASGVWSPAQTPLDEDGDPYRGPVPAAGGARVTASGGGVLVGRDPARPSGRQAVVLTRDPGGRWHALPAAPDDVVLPADELTSTPAEQLAPAQGADPMTVAAYDADGATNVLLPLVGRDADSAVAHWDGRGWSREPIDVPADSASDFHVLAVAASAGDAAYLVARTDATLGDGVVLFRRVVTSGVASWERQDLGAPLFARAATAASGVATLASFGGGLAQTLTATPDGVWVDGAMTLDDGSSSDFTFFWSSGAGRVTGSWCDANGPDGAALCADPLALEIRPPRRLPLVRVHGRRLRPPRADEPARARRRRRLQQRHLGELRRQRLHAPARRRRQLRRQRRLLQPRARLARRSRAGDRPARAETPHDLAGLDALAAAGGRDRAGQAGRRARQRRARRRRQRRRRPLHARQRLGARVPALLDRRRQLADAARRRLAGGRPRLRRRRPRRDVAVAQGDRAVGEDAAAPIAFDGNLMGVAFDPANGERGYAVGRGGVLLAYGKTWTQEALPAGFEQGDFTSVAFAGRQALVAAGTDLLVNDGDGSGWHVDAALRTLLAQAPTPPRIVTVAALPDGGAVAAGRGAVYERDSAAGPWRQSSAPLPNAGVVAAAAVRAGDRVRAVVAITPGVDWPVAPLLPEPDPELPDAVVPPFPLPGDGYLLRETDGGWRDEQRTVYAGVSSDKPEKSDPIAAFALDPATGAGWALGGWSGQADSVGRGTGASGIGATVRARVQTVAIARYAPDGVPDAPPSAGTGAVSLDPTGVTFAVAGHATCDGPCALLAGGGLGPDRSVTALVEALRPFAGQAGSPRALLYTGGRLPTNSQTQTPYADSARLAGMLAQAPLPVFGTVSAADSLGGTVAGFRSAYAALPAPFGTAATPAGVLPLGDRDASAGTRTHYAFDSSGGNGLVRVIVIDNSRGSLAASDPYQVPLEPQEEWLRATLRDAKAQGIPALVVGSRDLNTRFVPSSNVAADGDAIAKLLVDEGASAYLYERPEEQRVSQIPAGGAATIPAYGTGTLGYRSPIANAVGQDQADALFGDSGYLLLTVDVARRDGATNRAPVKVRMEPLIKQLSLAAVDGTLLRRSRPALFQGLGRRPLGGDRWGPISAADGSPNPTGADPYIAFPAALCQQANCATRMTPEYRFTSSDPDIADFVAVDPTTTNLRKPLQGSDGKVVTDAASGLLCAFNPGRTTLTVSAGGMSYSQVVTVQTGSVQQPCGTRPLSPDKFRPVEEASASPVPPPAPAPAPAPAPSPSPAPPPPPPPVVQIPVPPPARAPARVARPRPVSLPYVPPPLIPGEVPLNPPTQRPIVGVSPPPPTTSFTSPTPPGGATIRVYEERERKRSRPSRRRRSRATTRTSMSRSRRRCSAWRCWRPSPAPR